MGVQAPTKRVPVTLTLDEIAAIEREIAGERGRSVAGWLATVARERLAGRQAGAGISPAQARQIDEIHRGTLQLGRVLGSLVKRVDGATTRLDQAVTLQAVKTPEALHALAQQVQGLHDELIAAGLSAEIARLMSSETGTTEGKM